MVRARRRGARVPVEEPFTASNPEEAESRGYALLSDRGPFQPV